MEIIILFTALLTASFIIFPIIAYIKQKKLTRETGIQFLLLFLISIFYIAIGGAVIGGVIISSGNMGI
jgi:NADH:ubiquinone oxidoreductase subunit 2 (subunit N)